jgi:hypothetical protein
MADEARRRLAVQEMELMGALTRVGPAPLGMDSQRVAVTRRQLALKRLRVVARAWPSLRQALGQDFEGVGLEVLADIPIAARHHAVADGLAIVEHCCDRGQGGDAARLALLGARANWIVNAGPLRPRTWPWLGVARLRDSGRLAVATRLGRTHLWICPH